MATPLILTEEEFKELTSHSRHTFEIATYGLDHRCWLECITCGLVILQIDIEGHEEKED